MNIRSCIAAAAILSTCFINSVIAADHQAEYLQQSKGVYLRDGEFSVPANLYQIDVHNPDVVDQLSDPLNFSIPEIMSLIEDSETGKYFDLHVNSNNIEVVLFKERIETNGIETFEHLTDQYGQAVEFELQGLVDQLNILQSKLYQIGYSLRDAEGEVRDDLFDVFMYYQNKSEIAQATLDSLKLRATHEVQALKDAIEIPTGDQCAVIDYDYAAEQLDNWDARDVIEVTNAQEMDLRSFLLYSNTASQVLCRVEFDLYAAVARTAGLTVDSAKLAAEGVIEWVEENISFEDLTKNIKYQMETKLNDHGLSLATFNPATYRVNECPLIDYNYAKSQVTDWQDNAPIQLNVLNYDDSMTLKEFLAYYNSTADLLCTVGIDLRDYLPSSVFGDIRVTIENRLEWVNNISRDHLETALKDIIESKIDDLGIDPDFFKPSSYPIIAEIEDLAEQYSDLYDAYQSGDTIEAVYLLAKELKLDEIDLGIEIPKLPQLPALPALDVPSIPEDMEIIKEKNWSGFNIGDTSTVGTSAQAYYKLASSEKRLMGKAWGEASIHLFNSKHQVIHGAGTAQVSQSGYTLDYDIKYLGFAIDDVSVDGTSGGVGVHYSYIHTSLQPTNSDKGIHGVPPLGNTSFKVASSYHFAIGPVPVNLEFGASGNVRLDYEVALTPLRASIKAIPRANFNGSGDVSAGLKGVLEVGVNGTVAIIDGSIPLTGTAQIKFAPNGTPYFSNDISSDSQIEAMKGSIKAYVQYVVPRFGIPPWTTKTTSTEIFSWDGFSFVKRIMNWGLDIGQYRADIRGDLLDQVDYYQFSVFVEAYETAAEAAEQAAKVFNDIEESKKLLENELDNFHNLLIEKLDPEFLTLSGKLSVFEDLLSEVYQSGTDRRIAAITALLDNLTDHIYIGTPLTAVSAFGTEFPKRFAETPSEEALRLQLVNIADNDWKISQLLTKAIDLTDTDFAKNGVELIGNVTVDEDGNDFIMGFGGLLRLSDRVTAKLTVFDPQEVLDCRGALISLLNVTEETLDAQVKKSHLNSISCNGSTDGHIKATSERLIGKSCSENEIEIDNPSWEYCEETNIVLSDPIINEEGSKTTYSVVKTNLKTDRSIDIKKGLIPISATKITIFVPGDFKVFGPTNFWPVTSNMEEYSFEFTGSKNARSFSFGCDAYFPGSSKINTRTELRPNYPYTRYAEQIVDYYYDPSGPLQDDRLRKLVDNCSDQPLKLKLNNVSSTSDEDTVGIFEVRFEENITINDLLNSYSEIIKTEMAEHYSDYRVYLNLANASAIEKYLIDDAIVNISSELRDLMTVWYSAKYPASNVNELDGVVGSAFNLNGWYIESLDRQDWMEFISKNLIAIEHIENIKLMTSAYVFRGKITDVLTISMFEYAREDLELSIEKAYYFIDSVEYLIASELTNIGNELENEVQRISDDIHQAIAYVKESL